MVFREILEYFNLLLAQRNVSRDSKHMYLVSKLFFSLELSHWRRLNLEKKNIEVRDIKKIIGLNLPNTANCESKAMRH